MTGDQIRRAREERGWTQQQLATQLGVGLRTVGNWERGETVPQNRAGMLRKVLQLPDEDTVTDPLRSASDFALLSELMRRTLDRPLGREGGEQ